MPTIDLQQNHPINSSPGLSLPSNRSAVYFEFYICEVTGSLPLIRVIEGTTAVVQIPAADWDTTNDIRSRWASASGPVGDECGDVCNNVPDAVISPRYYSLFIKCIKQYR